MMVQQKTFFDAAEGARLRDEAIYQVGVHAPDDWIVAAMAAVLHICEHRPEFTTDAVWALLDRHHVPQPLEPRAMGAVMRRAVTNHWCVSTNRMSKSLRPDCHRRPLAVWQSIVYPSN